MMRTVFRVLGAASLMGAAACAAIATSTPAPAAGPDVAVRIEARHVPLGVGGATLAPGVLYAGGLVLRGSALHGLSDLKVEGDRAWAVSDFGALVRFNLRVDGRGRLNGADTAISRPLTGPDGAVLSPKANADAEGLAILPDGRVLISFERDHRIWSYGAEANDRPSRVATPDAAFPDNEGLEGLSAAPGGWLALGEGGGAWLCDEAACDPLDEVSPADDFRFTGADRDPEGGWFVVERYYSPPLDMRVRVRRLSLEGVLSEPLIELRPPASTDNFEGIAAVATPTGTRIYLLSDDNANPLQKTLLLAFDVAE
ncbi:MAG: esterase-like activity of phytase family protein [Alphaproteobacteria bacterium]|nr:esterase-like activity of phytase family protein [Alphaproteobacteria bacterium]MBU2380422.1 esterase-like activity of phytase family protein [Alphaproteobacteria bacterium]